MNRNQAMNTPDTEYAVEVSALYKRFKDFEAVKGLNFSIRRGEIFGLLGPNGSGKTTTLNMISGLSEATSGTIRVFGLDPRQQAGTVRRLFGVVPQETALYEELTAERNLAFHAELFGYGGPEKKHKIAEMLELAQLHDRAKSRVRTFSGGMKRRLAIVRAMLHDPWLVYLDEPTLGVDVQSRNVIWEYILQMKTKGRSVLLTTNYLEEASALCDRIAILDHGQLVAIDTPLALKTQFGSSVLDMELTTTPSAETLDPLRRLPGVQGVDVRERSVVLTLSGTTDSDTGTLIPRILTSITESGNAVQHLHLREPSLDEVFLALTGKGVRD